MPDRRAVLTDVEWAEARSHFEECPAPPDAECATCHAYEKERRRRCLDRAVQEGAWLSGRDDEKTTLVTALRAIRDEDWDALGLSARDSEAVRLSQGEADYLIIDAMRLAARRALEDVGEFG